MVDPEPDFLSCDWGTSSFRLRWVSRVAGSVLSELREPVGVRALYERAASEGGNSQGERAAFFESFLREQLARIHSQLSASKERLPLVISGMASSSVGWKELPYASVPFLLDGRSLRAETVEWEKPDWISDTYLISGMATAQDMMRGEETEVLGVMSEPAMEKFRGNSLILLPGTHSKHVRVESNAVTDFRTYMTGELFDVLGRHSLLRASVEMSAKAEQMTSADHAAFREGVLFAGERGLAGGLFRVRTRAVLSHQPISENTWFFSGLLIGAEIAALREEGDSPVLLAAGGNVAGLYRTAIELVLENSRRWVEIPASTVERATIQAHRLLLQNKMR